MLPLPALLPALLLPARLLAGWEQRTISISPPRKGVTQLGPGTTLPSLRALLRRTATDGGG